MLLLWFLTWFASFAIVLADSENIVYVTVVETTVQVEAAQTVYATPTVPSPASYTSLSDFKDTVLEVTNEYRDVHTANALVWNETLVEYARDWAEACIWKHSDGPYGENLAFGYANASAAVEAWGDEGKLYDYSKPTGFTEETGHFTQLVWRATVQVGCAAVNCGYTEDFSKTKRDIQAVSARAADGTSRAQGWYVVCEYTPPGNVVGYHNEYFKKNVWPTCASKATRSNATTSASTSMSTLISSTSTSSSSHSTEVCSSGQESRGASLNSTLFALVMVGIGMGLYF